MQRRLVSAAIVLGTIGSAPVILEILHILIAGPPAITKDPSSQFAPMLGHQIIDILMFLIVSPTLLLWGLTHVAEREVIRTGVFRGATLVCLATIPFIVGLFLLLPVIACGFLRLGEVPRGLDQADG